VKEGHALLFVEMSRQKGDGNMNEYKVFFNFDHENYALQIMEANSEKDALAKIPLDGFHDFYDKGKLVRVLLSKVTHIEITSNKKATVGIKSF
jgi:hypothetical protein